MKDNYYQDHHHSKQDDCPKPKQDNCEVQAIQQVPLADENTPVITQDQLLQEELKFQLYLQKERIQIVVESDIPLNPPATEIKRVKKHVFLDQVKLVPVRFARIVLTLTISK